MVQEDISKTPNTRTHGLGFRGLGVSGFRGLGFRGLGLRSTQQHRNRGGHINAASDGNGIFQGTSEELLLCLFRALGFGFRA